MKKYILTIIVLMCITLSYSQIKVLSGGNVGIGDATPSALLTVGNGDLFQVVSTGHTRTIDGTVSSPSFSFTSATNMGMYKSGTNQLSLSINSAEKIRITTSGFQGLGNFTFSSTFSSITSSAYIRGLNDYSTETTPDYTWYNNDQIGMFHPSSNIIGFSIGGSEKMRIYSDGNVGIGVLVPNNTIQVKDLINFNPAYYSTLLGYQAGKSLSTGSYSVAVGYQALYTNTTSSYNVAVGYQTLYANTSGAQNTAIGYKSLTANTSGTYNVASGIFSLYTNTSGIDNTASGYGAIYATTSGSDNSAFGCRSMRNNITGFANTAIGGDALFNNTTGSYNTALGYYAGYGTTNQKDTNCTFIGAGSGVNTGTGYSNATAIGYATTVSGRNRVAIGNGLVTLIQGAVNFTTYSDGRFKNNVIENVKGLEFIKKLRPITYQLITQDLDNFIIQNIPDSIKVMHQAGMDFAPSTAIIHSGFIAQEVDTAAIACGFKSSIVHTPENTTDPYGLSYAEFVVPLVKAVQEQQKMIEVLKQNQRVTDSLLIVLHNCCSSGTTPKTNQKTINNENTNEENQGGLQNNETKQFSIDSPKLYQNTPNPFSTKTEIKYYLPENSIRSAILIFDMQGKLLKTNNLMNKGNGSLEIFGGELKSGMYMYSLIIDGKEIDTKKMILTE